MRLESVDPSARLDLQIAQQPLQHLAVGVVLLPAGEVADVAGGSAEDEVACPKAGDTHHCDLVNVGSPLVEIDDAVPTAPLNRQVSKPRAC